MGNTPRDNATHQYVESQDVKLREYLEVLIGNLEKRMDERYEAQERAITVAREAAEKRLDKMNEFRETLRDQSKTFVTKSDLEAYQRLVNTQIGANTDDIKDIQLSDAALAGKASQSQVIVSYLLGIAGIIFGIINIITK
jgi:hypothetical protein